MMSLTKFVGSKVKSIWKTKKGLDLLERMGKSPFLRNIYFSLKGTFSRDQEAVFAGKIAYYRALNEINSSPFYLLRRNIVSSQ